MLVVHSIGLGEALSLWLSGQKLDGMAIYGVPAVWWSRAAKAATYLAGLTVILDIVGPERLRAWGERRKNRRMRLPLWFYAVSMIVAFTLVVTTTYIVDFDPSGPWAHQELGFSIVVIMVVLTIGSFMPSIVKAIARFLESPLSERYTRAGGFSLLSVAFVVDLLTS